MKLNMYANFVAAVADLKDEQSTGQLIYPYAIAAAAWDDIFEHARKSGRYSHELFGLYAPALDRLIDLSPVEFPGYPQMKRYQKLIGILARSGVAAAEDELKKGSNLSMATVPN